MLHRDTFKTERRRFYRQLFRNVFSNEIDTLTLDNEVLIFPLQDKREEATWIKI